jgi:hypothetical protein
LTNIDFCCKIDYESQKINPVSLILCIDFHGHPILSNESIEEIRYSCLKEIIFNSDLNIVIVSNHTDQHKKMLELERMVNLDNIHQWITIDPDANIEIDDIINLLEIKNLYVSNVIIGGTNTAGCVLKSRQYSAITWAKKGINTKIYLPMCFDYQVPGIDTMEKFTHAVSMVYSFIRENNLSNNIELISNFRELRIAKRIKG